MKKLEWTTKNPSLRIGVPSYLMNKPLGKPLLWMPIPFATLLSLRHQIDPWCRPIPYGYHSILNKHEASSRKPAASKLFMALISKPPSLVKCDCLWFRCVCRLLPRISALGWLDDRCGRWLYRRFIATVRWNRRLRIYNLWLFSLWLFFLWLFFYPGPWSLC